MTRLIESSLTRLTDIMAEMGDMVIESVSLAIDSYLNDINTSDKVRLISHSITKKYYEVEDLTFEMFLKYQPLGEDFRLIRSSTEISYAYARFGRYAYDISLLRDKFGNISECKNEYLSESVEKVMHMTRTAIKSFATLDIRTAVKIREDEEFIDRMYDERLVILLKSSNTKCALTEALLLRYLERISDHAVFMSDAINYIVTGKHRPSDKRIESRSVKK